MTQMPAPSRRQLMAAALAEGLAFLPFPSHAAPLVPLFVGTGATSDQTPQMLAWLGTQIAVTWDYRPTPWLRAQRLTAAGQGLMYGLSRTPQRDKELLFSLPVWTNTTWAIVRDGDQHAIRRFGDLAGQPVCWARGSSYGDAFTNAGLGRMDERESSDDDGALRMAAAGRCRAALITLETEHLRDTERHPALAGLAERGLAVAPVVMARTALHFATGRGSRWAWVIERINRVVPRSRGELERLRQG